jgi:hypothetical protein
VSAISIELLARTVLELMRLPEFANSDFRDVTLRAHELLIECVRTIEHFEQGNCTYMQAIREITGWKRISAKELNLFEKFYKDTYLTFPLNVPRSSRFDLRITIRTRERQLQEWKEGNSVPIRVCLEIKRDYNPVHFTTYNLRRFGLSRDQKWRALRFLEKIGQISITRMGAGKNPMVTLNWVPLAK